MPLLIETATERINRLNRRYPGYTCSICQSHFPGVNQTTGERITKRHFIKPTVSIFVNDTRYTKANVCHKCYEAATTSMINHFKKITSPNGDKISEMEENARHAL